MKSIVALIDFSDVTPNLIALAGEVARAMNSQLILLHVVMTRADFINGHERENVSAEAIALDILDRDRKLERLESDLKQLNVDASRLIAKSDSPRGNPFDAIVDHINRLAPDLIIMGSHGRGRLYQLLVGSVTAAVFRKVRRPVLLVPSIPSSHNPPPQEVPPVARLSQDKI